MSSEWVNDDVDAVFKVGQWKVAPSEAFNRIPYMKLSHLVSHECNRSKLRHDGPWVWQKQLHIPCPDCGEVCPDEIRTVFEMMK